MAEPDQDPDAAEDYEDDAARAQTPRLTPDIQDVKKAQRKSLAEQGCG
jgi:hypothetical protein